MAVRARTAPAAAQAEEALVELVAARGPMAE